MYWEILSPGRNLVNTEPFFYLLLKLKSYSTHLYLFFLPTTISLAFMQPTISMLSITWLEEGNPQQMKSLQENNKALLGIKGDEFKM